MDHDSKIACISWPDESPDFFVKENLDAADDWNEKLAEVKRFYSQYNDAKETLKNFQRFTDYDTGSDKPLGRGHRFRRGKRMTDSDTETPHPMKQSKLAAPPPVLLQKVSAKASTSSASRPVVVQKRGMVSQTKVKKLLSESKGKGKPEAPEKARLERLEQKKQRILSDREQKRNKNEEKRKQALNALTTRGNSAHHPIVKSTSKMESKKPSEKAPERNVSICLADKDKASKANSVKSQSMQNLSEPKTTEQSPIKYESSTSNNETTVPVKRVPLNNSTASKQKDNGLSITQEKTSEERVPDSEVQNPGDPVFERLRRLVG
ncbi:hepatoma-derived growth factor-related protein 2-like [Frankliniella occidentalis]|uniref:Hepatoma-derived growth factor-related protein 2-like n=1 Tax=Frankliniella occidentalis TaxID=133901 RepID=A0A9C6X5H8_FRAOC|nr:hepatoma-derived growth factor-related protein 2-like [Frankliniella occidentalis]